MKLLILSLLLIHIADILSYRNPIRLLSKKQLTKSTNNYVIDNHSSTIYRKKLSLLSYTSDSDKGISPKILGLIVILGLGIFGTSFVGIFNTAVNETSKEKVLKKSIEGESRGSMTKLTRREINVKLQQLPLFYATKDGGVYTEDDVGYIFTEKSDVESYIKDKKGLRVGATSADDIWFTLIDKKTKIGKFVEGVSSKSDPQAKYMLKASSIQLQQVPSDWKDKHPDDIPLFRVTNLAFNKNEIMEFPLFTRKDDAITSYQRLQESKNLEVVNKTPEIGVSSVKDILSLWGTGGFEGRSLELYPSMDAIENARSIMGLSAIE
jgi:hypothetical protein